MTTTAVAPTRPGTKEKNCTIYGRLSFPTWTAQEAYDRSQSGQYKAESVEKAAPNFQLLLEDTQLDKLRTHITDVYFPYTVAREAAGEKRDILTPAEVKALTEQIMSPDFDGPYNTPFRAVHEKTAPLAPEAVAAVKIIGNKGENIVQKAIVNEENELLVPEADLIWTPGTRVIRPIGATVHEMYPGCYVGVTVNLYSYHNGKLAGFSAGGSVAVFKADGERFGGGLAIDEDEIFMD